MVAVIAGRTGDGGEARERIVDGYVGERDVAAVHDREGIGDLLADLGRGRTGLVEFDPRGDVERDGERIGVGNSLSPVVPVRRCVVDERVGVSGLHGVVRGVDPGLGCIEDVVAVIAGRTGDGGEARERIVDGYVGERDVAAVHDREGIGDLLPDPGRARTGLGEVDPRGDVEGQGVLVRVGD